MDSNFRKIQIKQFHQIDIFLLLFLFALNTKGCLYYYISSYIFKYRGKKQEIVNSLDKMTEK